MTRTFCPGLRAEGSACRGSKAGRKPRKTPRFDCVPQSQQRAERHPRSARPDAVMAEVSCPQKNIPSQCQRSSLSPTMSKAASHSLGTLSVLPTLSRRERNWKPWILISLPNARFGTLRSSQLILVSRHRSAMSSPLTGTQLMASLDVVAPNEIACPRQ